MSNVERYATAVSVFVFSGIVPSLVIMDCVAITSNSSGKWGLLQLVLVLCLGICLGIQATQKYLKQTKSN